MVSADPKAATLRPLQLAAPDIVAWLLAKDPAAVCSWWEPGQEEPTSTLAAAQIVEPGIADDLYFAMVDNVERHGDFKDFQALVIPTLKAKGWLGGDDGRIASRVELIYDTNLNLARAAGRWTNYQQSKVALPYIRAFTVHDARVRHPPKSPHSDHRAWEGIILPTDDPFWAEYWPPLGFRCRCDAVQMTRSDLARYKGGVTTEADLERRKRLLGPPIFLAPGAPFADQLAAMVKPSNDATPRIPDMPPVDPVATARAGGDAFDAVMAATSLADIRRQLAIHGFTR